MPCFYWILLYSLFISKGAPVCYDERHHSCKKVYTREVSTALGGTAKLHCTVPSTEIQQDRGKWDRCTSANAKPYTVLTWPQASLSPESKHLYETRLTFEWGEGGVNTGNPSLSLVDVRKNDSGTYVCEVWKVWQCVMCIIINLKVKECEILDPITALPKTTVILPCPFTSYQGNITPQASWFLGPQAQMSLILQHPPTPSPLHSSDPIPLQGRFTFSGDSSNASLTISELNHSDSNWYRCMLHMGEKKKCQEMKLSVKDLPVSEMTTTTVRVNVTMKAIAKEETSGSPVVAVVSALSVCVAVAVIGSAAYIRYRKNIRYPDEDDLADGPYENIHTRNSAFLPSTLYTLAESETQNTCMDDCH